MTNGEDMGPGKDIPPWLQPVPEGEDNSAQVTSRKMLIVTIAGAVVVISLFVAVILYLYDGSSNQPPIRVAAPTQAVKEKPEDPGGMQVAHQDKKVFEQSDGMQPRSQVSLGPQPEKPVENIPDDPVGDVIEETERAAADGPEIAQVNTAPVEEAPVENSPAAEPKAQPAQTDAAEQTPAPAQEPAATPSSEPYKVQLGAYGNRDSASRAWRAIRAKFPTVLRNVLPTYEAVQSGDRTLYRLRVGPYISRAAADQVCLALRANQQACIVVNP